jgi:carboxymethylenebutenolidase
MDNLIELKSEDGHTFLGYLAQPKKRPKAGIVSLQEIFGVNAHIKEITDFYADQGYLSLAPALFDRIEKNVELDYNHNGVTKGRALKDKCGNNALMDIDAAISVVASAGKIGLIGYCWGGSLSWRTACQNKVLSACVSYYGGEIPTLKDQTPFCKFLAHFGELDKGIPIKEVDQFKLSQPDVLTYTYPADHGFNCNHRSQYNEISSKIALNRTIKFLDSQLS